MASEYHVREDDSLVTVIYLTFCAATGELVKGGKRMHVEGLRPLGIQSQSPRCSSAVCKPLLSVGECTTTGGVTVLDGDKGYLFHRGSNVAKKVDAWIQKEMRDSRYHGCTVAYKENNVYNIYMKPRRNKTDAMPLSESSRVPSRVRTCKTGESRSRSSRRSRRSRRSNARCGGW